MAMLAHGIGDDVQSELQQADDIESAGKRGCTCRSKIAGGV